MKTIRLSIIAIAAVLASAAVAFAAPATTTSNVNMRSGPNASAPVIDVLRTGTYVDAQCSNNGWCQVFANGQSGWVSSSYIALSVGPGGPQVQPPRPTYPPVQPPRPTYPEIQPPRPQPGWGNNNGPGWPGGPQIQPPRPTYPPIQPPRPQPGWGNNNGPGIQQAGACFYSERNFGGDSFCLNRGETRDRLPRNWDMTIRSVEVFGGVRVDLCSQQNQYGACTTLRSDAPRLANGLDRNVSSLDVY